MALPRYAGAREIEHPDAPKPEPVFLKGRYAIRRDGAVILNNPVINQRTDMQFVDELPQYHLDEIQAAKARDEAELRARTEYTAQQEDRILIQEAKTRAAIEASRQKLLETKPSPESAEKSAKFLIANADSVEVLAEFVEAAYGKKLDRRKSINTLRHEADLLRQSAEAL